MEITSFRTTVRKSQTKHEILNQNKYLSVENLLKLICIICEWILSKLIINLNFSKSYSWSPTSLPDGYHQHNFVSDISRKEQSSLTNVLFNFTHRLTLFLQKGFWKGHNGSKYYTKMYSNINKIVILCTYRPQILKMLSLFMFKLHFKGKSVESIYIKTTI